MYNLVSESALKGTLIWSHFWTKWGDSTVSAGSDKPPDWEEDWSKGYLCNWQIKYTLIFLFFFRLYAWVWARCFKKCFWSLIYLVCSNGSNLFCQIIAEIQKDGVHDAKTNKQNPIKSFHTSPYSILAYRDYRLHTVQYYGVFVNKAIYIEIFLGY